MGGLQQLLMMSVASTPRIEMGTNALRANSFLRVFQFAFVPIVEVLIMCGVGFLLATRHFAILSPSGNKLLSKLVFNLFLPALIFASLGAAITLEKMLLWWFIPINIVVSVIIGSIVGWIMVFIMRPPQEFVKFTVVMIGVGNIGNIPLVLINAICDGANNPFGLDPHTCKQNGVAYISFGQWVGAIIVYTYVYYMLSPTNEIPTTESSITHSLLEKSPSQLNNGVTKPWLIQVTKAINSMRDIGLNNIFSPPVTTSMITLIVGSIPSLKALFFSNNAPLSMFTDSLHIFGQAMIPCIMLALGGNLVGGPGSSRLGTKITIGITITRLFIVPPLGMGIVHIANSLKLLPPNDQMFRFVLLLQCTMPSSILAGAMASLRGVGEREASAILFWQHIVAIFSICFWLIVYLKFLF